MAAETPLERAYRLGEGCGGLDAAGVKRLVEMSRQNERLARAVEFYRFANVHGIAEYEDDRLRTVLDEGGPAEVVDFAALVLSAREGNEDAKELLAHVLANSPQFGGPR